MQILNLHTLESLLRWMSPADHRALWDALLVQLPEDFEQLQQAIARGDIESIQRQAHRIKGAYANIGCDALCHTMQLLEAIPEGFKEGPHMLSYIAEQFQKTQEALCAHRLVITRT
jgi:HPt (histidine-containing phosphotransfer) domain-containing protein